MSQTQICNKQTYLSLFFHLFKTNKFKTNIFVLLGLLFITLLSKYKPVEKKKPILETWNANDPIVYVWLFILR